MADVPLTSDEIRAFRELLKREERESDEAIQKRLKRETGETQRRFGVLQVILNK